MIIDGGANRSDVRKFKLFRRRKTMRIYHFHIEIRKIDTQQTSGIAIFSKWKRIVMAVIYHRRNTLKKLGCANVSPDKKNTLKFRSEILIILIASDHRRYSF